VILHCVQFVLLLGLLVAEVIIQQHQLLQKSSFGSSSSSSGTLPTTAQQNRGAYQHLPGSAGEAAAKFYKQDQQNAQKRDIFRAW
jgi:hypothetical protein